jgi:hypothetical protein
MAKQLSTKSNEPKSKPVEEIRIGSIKAAIWRNEGEQGENRQPQVRFNVTFQRIYRTNEGEWRSTDSFGRDDLLILGKVADAAHTRVLQLQGEAREQQHATDTADSAAA